MIIETHITSQKTAEQLLVETKNLDAEMQAICENGEITALLARHGLQPVLAGEHEYTVRVKLPNWKKARDIPVTSL
jgi:hypothetical protein